jgi:DNA repair protein RAD50
MQMAEQNEHIEILDDEKKKIKETIAKSEAEIATSANIINQVEDIENEIESSKNELERHRFVVKKQRTMLETDMTSNHSMQELKDMLRNFDEKVSAQIERKDDMEKEYRGLEKEIESLRKDEMRLNSELGKLSAEREAHEKRLRERFAKMENIAQTYSVDLNVSQTQGNMSLAASTTASMASQTVGGASQETVASITPEDMKSFFRALDTKEEGLKADRKSQKERIQAQEDKLQSKLAELTEKRNSIENGELALLSSDSKLGV